MSDYKLYKGDAYFANFRDAQNLADRFLAARVVRYERGYAVQLYKSGPYWPNDRMRKLNQSGNLERLTG